MIAQKQQPFGEASKFGSVAKWIKAPAKGTASDFLK